MVRTMLIAALIAGGHIDNDEESDVCWCMSIRLKKQVDVVADVGVRKKWSLFHCRCRYI